MLLWTPQSQFAGYYVAKEKGLYRERGLEVQILRGGPQLDPAKSLSEGKADFAILWLTSALSAIDQGVPLAHVAQIFNASHLAIVGWKERGVHTIQDLHARRVSVWEEPLRHAYSASFKTKSIEPKIVPQYYSVNLFLLGGVDACSVMKYNEYHAIYQSGVDESRLSVFPLKEHGIDFPEDGIYCLRATREQRPQVCKALAEASLAGWRYAAEHPEEAVDIVMKHVDEAKLPTNRVHMRWMLRVVLPSVFPEGGAGWTPGQLSRRGYAQTTKWLVELGAVKSTPGYEEFLK